MVWLLVGVGGAIGAVARHGLNTLITASVGSTFPFGIFAINVIGSTAIGFIVALSMNGRAPVSDEVRTFLAVGVLGGFTTFSSFSIDTLMLMRAGRMVAAIANCGGQVVLSLVAVWIGFRIGSGS
jgi:CrcB protein